METEVLSQPKIFSKEEFLPLLLTKLNKHSPLHFTFFAKNIEEYPEDFMVL